MTRTELVTFTQSEFYEESTQISQLDAEGLIARLVDYHRYDNFMQAMPRRVRNHDVIRRFCLNIL